jgi:N-methylhydantoinase B
LNPIELNLFANRLEAICEQMGEVLRNAAFSPNIRDRLDFSCALFDAQGLLSAQAAHIPVHLGSMAFAMSSIVNRIDWSEGDQIILNDPFLGGTHLPDVTLIAPVFCAGELAAFVVNRAHHANIGSETPGSMPVSSSIQEEGLVIAPSYLYRQDQPQRKLFDWLQGHLGEDDALGDFAAQVSANRFGTRALSDLISNTGLNDYREGLAELNDYAARLASLAIARLPAGNYIFEDFMDDDGQQNRRIRIRLMLQIGDGRVTADFAGSAGQVAGNINCPLSVAAAAVFYVFRCLMPEQTPACDGAFRQINVLAPEGSLLNARYPAAVAAGNVETSTRIVDVTLGALAQAVPDRIPAASHGSMNNIAMGSDEPGKRWNYYETIGGGMGAGLSGGGLSAVQTHMTNTLNTPVEVLESRYPLQLTRYAIRRGSGGRGQRHGGDGIIRSYRFLQPAEVSLLTERRHLAPWGINCGEDGQPGLNLLNNLPLPAKTRLSVAAGDELTVMTPGGGGYGSPEAESN